MSTREQLEATLVRAYDPAWPIAGKKNASERIASIRIQRCCRTGDEWDECAEYPLLLREHSFFCFFLFRHLERPGQDLCENNF